ncbi:MAG: TonB-dependent receptor, partial [Acidobacteria bacterium]|nr:TonB-dependent receptor [Acidobacteriota bacterium]
NPVTGAVVEILESGEYSPVVSVPTDRRGRTSVTVEVPVTVSVQMPGFEPLQRKIDSVPDGDIILQLVPDVFHLSVQVSVKDTPEMKDPVERSVLSIERSGARTVYDAIDKLIPSAHVPSRGILGHGLGKSNSLTLRGMGGSPTTQLLMVVDGRPDIMGLMGHPIPDFYTLTDVGSLSVTTGPASVLYGNRAMGGVIEVRSIRPEPGFHTELTTSLGSYYTGQNRLRHSGQLGGFQYLFAGGIDHTNGHRENSAFRNQDGTLQMSYRMTPVWKVSIAGRYGHFTVEDPGAVQTPTPGEWAKVGRGGYSIGLENRTEQAEGSVHFFSSHGRHVLSDGFRSVDSNFGFRLQQTFRVRSHVEFDVGGDASRYGGRATNILTDLNYGEHHVAEGGGFGRIRWSPSGGLQLNTGFRYDRNSEFGGVTAVEFGASYRLTEDYALSVAVAKGFRNPTIRELYLFPAPTPTLKPERLWNYQAGFQFRPLRRLLAWVTGYYADVDNLIVVTGRYPNLSLENIGRASNRGLEVNGRLRLTQRVSLSSGYAWFGSTNPAPYVPENKFIYSLDIDLIRAFVTYGGRVVGHTWADSARTVRLDRYATSTIKCTVPLGMHWSVFAMVDNLFNQQYRELAGYPMPGTNAAGGFNVRF